MSQEKDFLKKELSNLTEKGDIEKFKEDAELLGHEDISSLAQEKINLLNEKTNTESTERLGEVKTVEDLGGNEAEINTRVAEVDKEIEAVQVQAKAEIDQVEQAESGAETVVVKAETSEVEQTETDNEAKIEASESVSARDMVDLANEMIVKSPAFQEYKKAFRQMNEYMKRIDDPEIQATVAEYDKMSDMEIAEMISPQGLTSKNEAVIQIDLNSEDTAEFIRLTKGGKMDLFHESKMKSLITKTNKLIRDLTETYNETMRKLEPVMEERDLPKGTRDDKKVAEQFKKVADDLRKEK